MKNLKEKLISFAAVICLVLLPVAVGAQLNADNTGLKRAQAGTGLPSGCENQGAECVVGIISRVIGVALAFVSLILFVIFIYAGFLWMTSGGSEDNVKKAQTMIKNAVMGLVVITLSYIITTFVLEQLSKTLTPAAT